MSTNIHIECKKEHNGQCMILRGGNSKTKHLPGEGGPLCGGNNHVSEDRAYNTLDASRIPRPWCKLCVQEVVDD